jgi:hypothetical protein
MDDAAWRATMAIVRQPSVEGFLAYIEVIDDSRLAGVDGITLARAGNYVENHALLIVADTQTMVSRDHTLLCVHLRSLGTIRVIPNKLWSIENNLSLANMDFHEFSDAVDDDGTFRGFST